eukprot:TRINITY_DN76309_c0_g1_i1.p1 TRINITY_DN76309_c0_g1~~TRINITY_DN76309_c0_g1_i1.p1  ORF type:complete len:658 (-),score=122.38 TRINITY_DN76309_c0_g1_i1:33-2006(-)
MQLLPPDPHGYPGGRVVARKLLKSSVTDGGADGEKSAPSVLRPGSMLPSGRLRLRVFQEIRDAADWAGLDLQVWAAVADQLESPASLDDLAMTAPDTLRAALVSARVARFDDLGRPAAVAGILHESHALPSHRGLSPVEAAQVGLVWRVARASSGAGPRSQAQVGPAADLPAETHPREQLENAEWFEVAYSKVFIKKAPQRDAKSWGWVHKGQKVQVTSVRIVDIDGNEWVELTFAQLARSCPERLSSDDPLGRGFALVDGQHLGLGLLLEGPLQRKDWPGDMEEAQSTEEERVTLRRLSGEKLSVQVKPGDFIGTLVYRAAELLELPAPRVRLVNCGNVLNHDAAAVELAGKEVDLVVVPPSPRAVTGCEDGSVMFWDLEALTCIGSMKGHRGAVWTVDADVPSKLALSGSADTSLMMWDLERLECLRSFEGHSGAVCAVSADFSRKWAVSGSDDGTLRTWSFGQRGSLLSIRCAQGTAWSLSADFDHQAAVSGHEGGTVQVWDLSEGACVHIFEGSHSGLVQVVMSDFPSSRAGSGSDDGTFCLWDLGAMACLHRLEVNMMMCVWSASRDFASSLKVLSGSWDGSLQVWDVKGRMPLDHLRGAGVCSLSVDFAAGHAVTGTYGGEVFLWDLASKTCVPCLERHSGAVRCLATFFE